MSLKKNTPFFVEYLKDFKIGAVMPSTRFIVRRVIKAISFDTTELILEFGAGEGVITRAVLEHMKSDALLVAFEPNESMKERLLSSVSDNRFQLVEDIAENAEKYIAGKKFDLILASNPFSKIVDRRKFLQGTARRLNEKGSLIIFNQHIPIGLYADLRSCFKNVRMEWEPRNVPPCFNFICADPIHIEYTR